jgi:predicted transcriptional regulator
MPPGPDPQIPTEDILRVSVESPDPAFVAREIAAELDCTPQGARNRLETLVESGYLAAKRPGQRTTLYWLTEAGHEFYFQSLSEADSLESHSEGGA